MDPLEYGIYLTKICFSAFELNFPNQTHEQNFSLKRKRRVVPPVGDLKENSLPALHFPH
jgi:hypothetical protein